MKRAKAGMKLDDVQSRLAPANALVPIDWVIPGFLLTRKFPKVCIMKLSHFRGSLHFWDIACRSRSENRPFEAGYDFVSPSSFSSWASPILTGRSLRSVQFLKRDTVRLQHVVRFLILHVLFTDSLIFFIDAMISSNTGAFPKIMGIVFA